MIAELYGFQSPFPAWSEITYDFGALETLTEFRQLADKARIIIAVDVETNMVSCPTVFRSCAPQSKK